MTPRKLARVVALACSIALTGTVFAAEPAADATPEPLPTVTSAVDVARLHEAGEPEARLIAAIYASPPFVVSSEQLELLGIAGVPKTVVATLARRSLEADSGGVAPATTARPVTAPPSAGDGPGLSLDPEPAEPPRSGFVAALGLGVNVCVGEGDPGYPCYDARAGIAVDASVGYRFNRWVTLTLDGTWATYAIRRDTMYFEAMGAGSVMLAGRLHAPLSRQVDLTLGAAIGYARWDADVVTSRSLAWSSFLGYGVLLEVSYRLRPELDVGLAGAFVMHPEDKDLCEVGGGQETCGDYFGVPERITLGLRFTYRVD